jgi:RNA polymerase sigma factor (sigma-70 family)
MLIEFPNADGDRNGQETKARFCRFDDAYLARLRNNDEKTARHFHKHFRKAVGSMLFGKFYRQREEDLAEDVMAAVIERVIAGEPRDGAMLPAYVRGVCLNFIRKEIDRIRSRPERGDVDFDKQIGNGKTPEETLRAQELAKAVWDVLATLRIRYRNILIDVFYHELDREEVRRKYGKTPEQMRLILFHARRRFQKEWRKRNETDSERRIDEERRIDQ